MMEQFPMIPGMIFGMMQLPRHRPGMAPFCIFDNGTAGISKCVERKKASYRIHGKGIFTYGLNLWEMYVYIDIPYMDCLGLFGILFRQLR